MTAKYECQNCGNTAEVADGKVPVPECCNRPMQSAGPLPVCTTSETAEHTRLDNESEPCDDGRAGEG